MTTTLMQIRSLVHRQIISALEDDLEGGELLTKEVWEQCETDDDVAAAKHELGQIVDVLRSLEPSSARDVPSRDEMTSLQVEAFTTYPSDLLLDELVMCTVRYNLGDLAADERRVATAILERLSSLGIARKEHRAGCEIWPQHRLCRCPWSVAS